MQKLKTTFLTIISAFVTAFAVAQEKALDLNVNVNKGNSNWYAQPWVWIVGGALFILLLVALLRSGSKN